MSESKNISGGAQGARILVVDDSLLMRETLGRWLRSAAYQCESAADVEEAISKLGGRPVDLVITDYCLPTQSGLDLLLHLQDKDVGLPVLMLTASGNPDIAMKAMTHGAAGYLHKPVRLQDLLIQVRRALEVRRKFQAGGRQAVQAEFESSAEAACNSLS
jgi:DNA-binding NtrC family response regulator